MAELSATLDITHLQIKYWQNINTQKNLWYVSPRLKYYNLSIQNYQILCNTPLLKTKWEFVISVTFIAQIWAKFGEVSSASSLQPTQQPFTSEMDALGSRRSALGIPTSILRAGAVGTFASKHHTRSGGVLRGATTSLGWIYGHVCCTLFLLLTCNVYLVCFLCVISTRQWVLPGSIGLLGALAPPGGRMERGNWMITLVIGKERFYWGEIENLLPNLINSR